MKTLFLSALASLLLGSASLALGTQGDEHEGYWPQWRGPDRDGLSKETGWVPEGAAEPVWSTQVGLGYSSVSVAKGRLYTLGYDEEAKLDLVWCLDAKTGDELWVQTYPAEIWNQAHRGGTLTTPSIDGDVVFTSNREGNLYCWKAETGDEVWHQNFVEEYELELPTWGFAASPLVLDDQLIMNYGRVFSLDKATGKVRWVTEKNYGHAYSTPTTFELEGSPALAVFNGDGVAVLDMAAEGGEMFTYPWKTPFDVNAGSPIVTGDRIYVSSGQTKGNALLRITAEGLKPVWEGKSMSTSLSESVLIGGHLYGFDDSVLKCIDLDGKEQWAERGIGNGAVSGGTDKLIVIGSKGELIVAEATPAGFKELSRAKVLESDGAFWSKPVLAGGMIYCRSSLGELACLDHRAKKAAPAGSGR